KRFYVLLLWGVSLSIPARAFQLDVRLDSLRRLLAAAPPDTARVLLLAQLAYENTQSNPLATIYYGKQALRLAQKLNYPRGEAWALIRLSSGFREAGNYPAALQVVLQGLRLAEELRDQELIGRAFNSLGYLYWEQGYSRPALAYFFKAKRVAEKSRNVKLLTRIMGNIGNVYTQLNRLDSARHYLQVGYAMDLSQHDLISEVGDAATLGNIYAQLGNPRLAKHYYRRSIQRALGQHITFALCRAYLGQAKLFKKEQGPWSDSTLYFAHKALAAAQEGNYPKGVLEASRFLSATYAARRDNGRAFRYLTLASTTRDSLFSQTKMAQVQALEVSEQLRQQELAIQQAQTDDEHRSHWLIAALASIIPVLLLLWRMLRHKQRANLKLNVQNAEIANQRNKLSATLSQLKATQAQLVQREKIASLGELTAGIAHEIQNPLNFVNNFAEVSTELAAELQAEAAQPEPDLPALRGTAAELKENQEKIYQHGRRAANIVRDMLAHARTIGGERVLTDLNSLADEHLRLAYHSIRAKDPQFVATITAQLDPALGRVRAVPQALGRVLINLLNNAFYAVQQRQKVETENYCPEVQVSTRRRNRRVEVRVRDNGLGIPGPIRDKIFQPFFTTKPAGEGTGLGLSLSYDIITHGHGGTLTVDSQEGEFTEFIIDLPQGINYKKSPPDVQLAPDVAIMR
ncbi:histidine kinase, partial [Hymenobacter roseosalivarius DSM 11622]